MPTKSIIHESVVSVLKEAGVKPKGSGIAPSNHRGLLAESGRAELLDKKSVAVIKMQSHPKLSDCSWEAKTVAEAKTQAFAACKKAGGFAIFESCKDGVLTCRFTRDAAKATVKDEATLAASIKEDDETDGTGEPTGDTKTDVEAKNDKGVSLKTDVQVDNKGENLAEGENEVETKKIFVNKEKLAKYKELMAKKAEAAKKKPATAEEKKEVAEQIAAIDAELDQISEEFYSTRSKTITFVLYEGGVAEVHGLNEDELAPFGGTAPAMPVRYAKKAKDAGPNSKVDMGVFSLQKIEGMAAQSATILTGKDFKANGWGTPGKGTGKQGKWSDTGKHPLDSAKKLKAGQE
jgi:hypothetical protein